MPYTATFDELLSWGGYANYVQSRHSWQYLFVNGVFYTGRRGEEVGRKCGPSAILDKALLAGGW